MRHFADPHMHKVQRAGCGCGKEPVEHGDDDPTCLLTAEIVRGKERNQCGDKDRGVCGCLSSHPVAPEANAKQTQGLEMLLKTWRARSANGDFGSSSMILWNCVRACTVSFSF
jgi:hypothetical protein